MARWLLKTEPDCYSFDDLARDRKTVWDGVTNALALKHIRAMKKGDPVLIYHTGGQRQAVGVAEVASNPYPDPKEDDERLVVVDLKARKKLPRPVTRSGSFVSWCMSTMWANDRNSRTALSARCRLSRTSRLTRNAIAAPISTRLASDESTSCAKRSTWNKSPVTRRLITISPSTAKMPAINTAITARSNQFGWRMRSARTTASLEIVCSSLAMFARLEPGKRSSIRRCKSPMVVS